MAGRFFKSIVKKFADKNSVKEAFDTLPEGVCYFNADGLTELCNLQMYRLCHMMMDRDVQTLDELINAFDNDLSNNIQRVSDRSRVYIFPDGSVWDMSMNDVTTSDGAKHTEVILFNVSELYEKRMELVRQTQELQKVASDIRSLSENLQEITQEQEILAFKTRLHDRMGAGLIAIRHGLTDFDNTDSEALAHSVSIFQNAVRQISEESMDDNVAEHDRAAEIANLKRDAAMMGAEITVDGAMPAEKEAADVFMIAVRECLTNGIRHAGATQINAVIMQRDAARSGSSDNVGGYYCLMITNNGKRPEKEITPGGGLLNLKRHVKNAGGSMSIQSAPEFMLTVEIPADDISDEREGRDDEIRSDS